MNADNSTNEFPDAAGYPDGKGTLDEGTGSSGVPAEAQELNEPSTDRDAEIAVTADDSGKAYRATLAGEEIAVMHVSRGDDGVVTLTSTVVDPAVRDRGIGTSFVAHVLDQLRNDGSRIVVECSMVEAFIGDNPEYEDLRA